MRKKRLTNFQRWILAMGFAFWIGVFDGAVAGMPPRQAFRHGIVALGPAFVALKLTLDK